MPLSPDEQELFDLGQSVLPDEWLGERQLEDLRLAAKMAGSVKGLLDDWLGRQALASQADGKTSTTPDWLGLHAHDHGTDRKENESTISLRDRTRNVESAITRLALLQAAQAILSADGVVGTVNIVELPRDAAYVYPVTGEMSGTGGTFASEGGGVFSFAPTVKFPIAPYTQSTVATGEPATIKIKSGRIKEYRLVFTGAASGANNGTVTVTGLKDNAALFVNAGAAQVDATVAWKIQRIDRQDQVVEGWARSFYNRGFRLRINLPTIIVILPFGTGTATRNAVSAMLRQKKAGGVRLAVETRTIP